MVIRNKHGTRRNYCKYCMCDNINICISKIRLLYLLPELFFFVQARMKLLLREHNSGRDDTEPNLSIGCNTQSPDLNDLDRFEVALRFV